MYGTCEDRTNLLFLSQKDGSQYTGPDRPQASSLSKALHSDTRALLVRTISSCAVRQRAVDKKGLSTLVVANIDEGLVQSLISTVADEFFQCGWVFLATAHFVLGAPANDRQSFVSLSGAIVEGEVIAIGVQVRPMMPRTRPES